MKPILLFFLAYTLLCNPCLGQTDVVLETYPDKYTFEKARDFEQRENYEKAVWFYINLFPENKTKVAFLVQTLETTLQQKIDSFDMKLFIQKAFAIYSTFDPAIVTIENGMPVMDLDKLKSKGILADELSVKVAELNKPLSSASDYNLRSMERYKSKDYQGTINDLNLAIKIAPSGEYFYNRAFTKSMMDDYKNAATDYDKVIELKYKLPEAFFERGFCKDKTGNLEGAITDYTNALALKSDYSDAYNNRGFIFYKQKNYKKAIDDFNKAIKLKGDYKVAYVNRGFAKKDSKDFKGACRDWQKALELGYAEAKNLIEKYCKQ